MVINNNSFTYSSTTGSAVFFPDAKTLIIKIDLRYIRVKSLHERSYSDTDIQNASHDLKYMVVNIT